MDNKELNRILHTSLELDREVIGVKFLDSEEEYDKESAKDIVNDMRYCVLIQSATRGHRLKIRGENFLCSGSGTTFGYHDLPDNYYSGESYLSYGLHKDLETSKKVVNDMYIMDRTYGLVAGPLETFTENNPDVIILVTNSYNAMRLSQGYSHQFGLKKDFNIAGNQAICLESTAVPLLEKDMNISMLCAGTRYAAGWDDDELSIGISYEIIEPVVEGLIQTINTIEPDEKKDRIIEKNGSDILEGVKITKGTAYFLDESFS